MIPVARSHEAYLQFVVEHLNLKYGESKAFLEQFYADLIFWITPVDLSPTASIMKDQYSPNPKGRRPHDPADLLRSLLLMNKLHITKVDEWVAQMATVPVYAILSGFPPDVTPGVGTFYDFFRRMWRAASPHLTGRKKRKLKKPKKKGKKNQKQEPDNPNITEKLLSRVQRQGRIHYTPKAHDLMQRLFQTMFVLPSAEKGLLGNPQSLSVIADGSPVVTGAKAYGKFLCECRKKGVWNCDCKREFSDPDANWGWDSYRERYFYGRHLYMFTAADSPYNLPLYPRLFKASQHDAVSWVCGYHEFLHWYPQWNIGEVILDSAHDAYPIYSYLESHDVSAIIELNPRKATKFTYNEMDIGLDGVPICPIGRKMINWGKEAKRFRRKWRCPAKVGKWECPHPCSTSDYGRTFHTSTADNPRLFPRVPRGSKEWRNRYKLRTGVERCIKRQKIDYRLEDSRGRSSRHWSIRVYLIAMCQHADAWFEEAKKHKLPSLEQWFAANQAT